MNQISRIAFSSLLVLFASCSHGQKKTPELSQLIGKKVALVDVTGEKTARNVAEVALINQLTERGTFILISKQDIDAARTAYQQDPNDWKGIAKRAGADYALVAHVLEFKSDEREGYSSEKVEDTALEAETGDPNTIRYYKVKSLTGTVRVQLEFANLKSGDTRVGVTEKTDTVTADEKNSGANLPPRLRFLEGIANAAFREFFDKYN